MTVYKEIIEDIKQFMKTPERMQFVKKSAMEAKEAAEKLVESMRYKGDD